MNNLQLDIIAVILSALSFIALFAALYYDKLDTLLKSIVWVCIVIVAIWSCYGMWLFALKAFVV